MQARRPISSAFRGGAAAAILLALGCAPHASASNIETDCATQRADRVSVLDVAADELDARLNEPGIGRTAETESADRVPATPEFEAVMTRILEASVLEDTEDDRSPVNEVDSSPVAGAETDADVAEPSPGDAEWAIDSAHLPGLSEAAAERYRRQMYRTDI